MSFGRVPTNSLPKFLTSSDGGPTLAIAGTALAIVLFAAWLHPHPIVLPLLSIILVLAALVVAAFIAVQRHLAGEGMRGTPLLERMLLPGLLMFCGFAAAMMGDPDLAVQSLNH